MLLSISYQLRDALKARGVPFDVVYGPERLGQTPLATSHVVLERDRSTGDELQPVTAHRRNPRVDHVRGIGAVLRIFARSTAAGAGPGDHERLADRVVDQCLISLRAIVAARRTQWRLGSAKLLSADEAGERGLETWPGVIYEARFVVDRGVADMPWTEAEAAAGAAGTATGDEATFGGAHGVGTATTIDTSDGPEGSDELPSATTRT